MLEALVNNGVWTDVDYRESLWQSKPVLKTQEEIREALGLAEDKLDSFDDGTYFDLDLYGVREGVEKPYKYMIDYSDGNCGATVFAATYKDAVDVYIMYLARIEEELRLRQLIPESCYKGYIRFVGDNDRTSFTYGRIEGDWFSYRDRYLGSCMSPASAIQQVQITQARYESPVTATEA